jgi:hypothetical protein
MAQLGFIEPDHSFKAGILFIEQRIRTFARPDQIPHFPAVFPGLM